MNVTHKNTRHPSPRGAHATPISGTFLSTVRRHIEEAAERIGLDAETERALLEPERVIEVRFAVSMDDGTERLFVGWRVVHDTTLGPGKGGIRIAPDVTKETVTALATEMSIKCALHGLPLGGAKGGIAADPEDLSEAELARLMRAYVRAVLDARWHKEGIVAFGPEVDVPAPDLGTSPRTMNLMDIATDELIAWRMDQGWAGEAPPSTAERPQQTPLLEAQFAAKGPFLAAFTGKSVARGGLPARAASTGRGVVDVAEAMLESTGSDLTGATVAIQGLGNVGLHAARTFIARGAKVIAILEHDGAPHALLREAGFNLETLDHLEAYRAARGSLRGTPLAKPLTESEFWALPVDLLVPCATERAITEREAPTIQARFIIEGANGPTTPTAAKILFERGVVVVPDVLCNGAGVTVSMYEIEQNLGVNAEGASPWTRLATSLNNAVSRTNRHARAFAIPPREAAYDTALMTLARYRSARRPPKPSRKHARLPLAASA